MMILNQYHNTKSQMCAGRWFVVNIGKTIYIYMEIGCYRCMVANEHFTIGSNKK